MNPTSTVCRAGLLALALALASTATAQTGPRSVVFPAPLEPWSGAASIGASVTVLPRPIAEEEVRQVPLLDVGGRLGLPYGLSAVGRATTNWLTNSGELGLQWSYRLGKYSAAVGDRFSIWYGQAAIEGFDASALGVRNHPYVTLGADFTAVRVLVGGELTYTLHRTSRVGDEQVATNEGTRVGGVVTAAVEQRFIAETDVTFGVRVFVTDSAVQSWLAFSTFQDKLVFPELFFSVNL